MSTRATVTINGPTERDQVARWARNVEAGTVVTFRKKSRSTDQNAKLHAMLGEVAKQVEWHGQHLDLEDWKDMFTAALRHARVVPGIDKGTYVPLGMHTSTLTIEEMSNLIELIYAFGADPEHLVIFKDPKDPNSGHAPTPEDADAAPSASAEPDGDPLPSSGSTDPERETLIKYASQLLPMAAIPGIKEADWKEFESGWSADIQQLAPESRSKAREISVKTRDIFKGQTSLDQAVIDIAAALECRPDEIGGVS